MVATGEQARRAIALARGDHDDEPVDVEPVDGAGLRLDPFCGHGNLTLDRIALRAPGSTVDTRRVFSTHGDGGDATLAVGLLDGWSDRSARRAADRLLHRPGHCRFRSLGTIVNSP